MCVAGGVFALPVFRMGNRDGVSRNCKDVVPAVEKCVCCMIFRVNQYVVVIVGWLCDLVYRLVAVTGG